MADADAMRLEIKQAAQRAKPPKKVAQDMLHAWCRSNLSFIDPFMAADLVKRIEWAIKAERATGRDVPEGTTRTVKIGGMDVGISDT